VRVGIILIFCLLVFLLACISISTEKKDIVEQERLEPVFAIGLQSCGMLDSPNTVYYLMQDVRSDDVCFTISHKNITLDCEGHTVEFGSIGVRTLRFVTDATIMNCKLKNKKNDYHPIMDEGSGIYIFEGSRIKVINVTVEAVHYGIYIVYSSDNEFMNNKIISKGREGMPVYISYSRNNLFVNNIIAGISGVFLESSNYNSFVNNTIFEDGAGGIPPKGGVYLMNSSFNNFTYNKIGGGSRAMGRGVTLNEGSCNNVFKKNTIIGRSAFTEGYGVMIYSSHNNTFVDNKIEVSGRDEAWMAYVNINSTNNVFSRNSFTSPIVLGIIKNGCSGIITVCEEPLCKYCREYGIIIWIFPILGSIIAAFISEGKLMRFLMFLIPMAGWAVMYPIYGFVLSLIEIFLILLKKRAKAT